MMMTEVSIFRLNMLRAVYLLLVVGLGIVIWPSILDYTETWELSRGIVVSMLGSMSGLAVFGLRYPLQMLPILLFEIGWKIIWLFRVALPLWTDDRLDAATAQMIYECSLVIIFLIIVPWGYVLRNYVLKASNPWRRCTV